MAGYLTRLASGVKQFVKAITTSTGASDADKMVATNASGVLDPTLLNASALGGGANADKIPMLNGAGTFDQSMMPTGVGAETNTFTATEALAAGDLVNKWDDGGGIKVRLADANGKPAHGFVKDAVTNGGVATVYTDGKNDAVTGLTPGPQYLGSTAGKMSASPVSDSSGLYHQKVGYADSATIMIFENNEPILMPSS